MNSDDNDAKEDEEEGDHDNDGKNDDCFTYFKAF